MADTDHKRATEAKARIFISYSRKDLAFADRLERALTARSFEPLIDREAIEDLEDWRKRIETLIAQCDTMVFVLSPDAIASPECKKEVEFAATLNKRFAPIVWRTVVDSEVPDALARINRIDFGDGPFDDRVDRLVKALATDLAWIRKHTEYGEAARRWSAAARPDGLLLHSPALEQAESWIASRPHGAPEPVPDTQVYIAESRRGATRRRNILTGGLVAGLIIALGLAGLAFWQRGVAVEQRDQALLTQSRFLADTANQLSRGGDSGSAILLTVEALPDPQGEQRPYTSKAETALYTAVSSLHEVALIAGAASLAQFRSGAHEVVAISDDAQRVWDATTGRLLHETKSGGANVTLSPDGHYFAAVTSNKTVEIRDIDSGALVANLAASLATGGALAFSPDGRTIAIGLNDNTAGIWDVHSGRELAVLKGHLETINQIAFKPDGTIIATASSDRTARLWDVKTGALLKSLEGHRRGVLSVAFNGDGSRLATGSGDRTVRIWDTESGLNLMVLRGHVDPISSVSFSPDGRRLLTMSTKLTAVDQPNTARLWDAESGDLIAAFDGYCYCGNLLQRVFSTDGKYFVTASADNTAKIRSPVDGHVVLVLAGHLKPLQSAAFSPDGKQVVTASGDDTVRVWNMQGPDQAVLIRRPHGRAYTVAFSPDGDRLVIALEDDQAEVADAHTGKILATLAGHVESVEDAEFSPDGKLIVTASADRTARIWDAASGDQLAILLGHDGQLTSASFSPNGQKIVTTSYDHTARIWDASTGRTLAVLRGHRSVVTGAAFSRDGRRVVTSSLDSTARIWDADTGQSLATINVSSAIVSSAKYSGDGRKIVTASDDGTARIWDAETAKLLLTLDAGEDKSQSPFDRSYAEFSPDLGHVIGSFGGRAARIWNLESKKVVAVLGPHPDVVTSARFAPSGRLAATASKDGAVRLWHVFSSTRELLDEAKRLAPRCLTSEQRFRLFLGPTSPRWCAAMKKWPYQ
jgi:WD40 repeat protein